MAKRALFSQAGFPPAIVSRSPDEDGVSYAMTYGNHVFGYSGSEPLERQSARQPYLRYRLQFSRYISKFMLGLQSEINYPIARGNTIVNTAPDNIGAPPNGRQGTMLPPSRFTKALPNPIVPFNPPVYGES